MRIDIAYVKDIASCIKRKNGHSDIGYILYVFVWYVVCLFYLQATRKRENPIRQHNTWRPLSDGTIWCESGFDSSRNTDWLRPLSTGSSWQKQSTANQSSRESSRVWALLIILFPLGQKPICLIFNTTNFPLSHWQSGSRHCLKSCNENNFF